MVLEKEKGVEENREVGDKEKKTTNRFQGLPQPPAQVELSCKLGLRLTNKMKINKNKYIRQNEIK